MQIVRPLARFVFITSIFQAIISNMTLGADDKGPLTSVKCRGVSITDIDFFPQRDVLSVIAVTDGAKLSQIQYSVPSLSTLSESKIHGVIGGRTSYSASGKFVAVRSLTEAALRSPSNDPENAADAFSSHLSVFHTDTPLKTAVREYDLRASRSSVVIDVVFVGETPISITVENEKKRLTFVEISDKRIISVLDTNWPSLSFSHIVVSGDAKWAAAARGDIVRKKPLTAVVWQIDGDAKFAFEDPTRSEATCIALSRHGDRLAAATADGQVVVWSVKDKGKLLTRKVAAHESKEEVRHIMFSPRDDKVAIVRADGQARLIDIAGKENDRIVYNVGCQLFKFSADGRWLAAVRMADEGARFIELWEN